MERDVEEKNENIAKTQKIIKELEENLDRVMEVAL